MMPRVMVGTAVVVLIFVAVAIGVFAGMQLSGPSQETEGTGSDQRESEREVVYKIIYIGEPVSIALPPEENAEVAHESGARIVVPAGAVAVETTVSVAEVEPPTGALEVDRAYDFSVGDAELLEPVTVHIPFELDEGQDFSGIYALHWNEDLNDWDPVYGVVDESTSTIAVSTSDLSVYSAAWVSVSAECTATPNVVHYGDRVKISSTGASLTSGSISIYMAPFITKEPTGREVPLEPDATSQIASVGASGDFELTHDLAPLAPGQYLVHCRMFWETAGRDVELREIQGPGGPVALSVEESVTWGAVQAKPPYLHPNIASPGVIPADGGSIVIEFTTEGPGAGEISPPWVEVSLAGVSLESKQSQSCGETPNDEHSSRCWMAEFILPPSSGPFDLEHVVTVSSDEIYGTLTGSFIVSGDPEATLPGLENLASIDPGSIVRVSEVACSPTDLYLIFIVSNPVTSLSLDSVGGRLEVGSDGYISHLYPLATFGDDIELWFDIAVKIGWTVASIGAGLINPVAGIVIALVGTAFEVADSLIEAQGDQELEEMKLGNYVEVESLGVPVPGRVQPFLVHVRRLSPGENWELSMTAFWEESGNVTKTLYPYDSVTSLTINCPVEALTIEASDGTANPGVATGVTTGTTDSTTQTGTETPSTTATDPVSPATIREVLTALYDATDGPNWHNQGNWFSGRPIDEWHGVSIDTTHRLIALDLSGNRLSGEIPPELGRLTDLKGISFSGNQLTGEIPPELGNLTNLEGLNLQGNQLTGQIPGALGNLINLANLSLQGNQLTGQIPAELGNLTNLQSLDLSKNQLNGQIPAALGNLTRLRTLNLNENRLSGQIPAAMGNMTYLARLDLTENQLSGQIPAELGSLPGLFNLTLHGNQFSGCLPPKLDSLANSDVFGFALPFCVEAAPPSTGPAAADRAALVAFADGAILGRNWLTTAPIGRWGGVKTNDDGRVISLVVSGFNVRQEHLSQLTSLEVLRLTNLRGGIPPDLGNLTNLRELSLSGTTIIPNRGSLRPSLGGEIPAELGNLANLEILNLDSWGWGGEIPAQLGNLTNLRELIIRGAGSQLTGEIPVELGNLTQLRRLALESDLLRGEIPRELGNLVNLEALSLSGNNLTGCLPSAFERLSMSAFVALGFPLCAK